MSHENGKNVTEPHRVSQLTTSCLCDHRVTVLEVVGVSAVECVPLLLENRILFCWVPHRKSWLHFFPAFDRKRIRYWCLIMMYLSLTVTCMSSIVTGLYSCTSIIRWRGCNPQEYSSYVLTVTSSGSLGYSASRSHFARTIETPLCVHARHLSPHSVPPSTQLLLSLWALPADSSSLHRLCLHRASRFRMCLCVPTHLFACMPVISLRVCMSAPEIPAPPRWAWSHGPARRTRQLLRTHTAPSSHPPRIRSSILTNSAWTHSGARWKPSAKGVAKRNSTAAEETPDSQKVKILQILCWWIKNR